MEKRRGRGEETHCLNSLVSQSFLLVRTEWKGMERMNPLKRPRKDYAEREKRQTPEITEIQNEDKYPDS